MVSCHTSKFASLLFAASSLHFAGCQPVRQPTEMVGTWRTEQGVTLTLGENGTMSMEAKGTVPPLFTEFLQARYWESRHGNLYIYANGPDDELPRFQSECAFEKDGQVLTIGVYKFSRE